jgi:hypothetical protein
MQYVNASLWLGAVSRKVVRREYGIEMAVSLQCLLVRNDSTLRVDLDFPSLLAYPLSPILYADTYGFETSNADFLDLIPPNMRFIFSSLFLIRSDLVDFAGDTLAARGEAVSVVAAGEGGSSSCAIAVGCTNEVSVCCLAS